jgi:excisionase family DNA binding protein
VSRTTVYRLVSNKEMPSYRIGQSVRVRRTDVERWLELDRETPND